MKTSGILNIVILVIFCCTGIAFSDDWKDESGKRGRDKQKYEQRDRDERGRSDHRDYRDERKRHDNSRDGDHKKGRDYHKYGGYKDRPYQEHRRYEHHEHNGHRYEYHGHWKSWEQWDRYKKTHPDISRHGDYYREDAHLMFRFRDPVTGGLFFFSIGR